MKIIQLLCCLSFFMLNVSAHESIYHKVKVKRSDLIKAYNQLKNFLEKLDRRDERYHIYEKMLEVELDDYFHNIVQLHHNVLKNQCFFKCTYCKTSSCKKCIQDWRLQEFNECAAEDFGLGDEKKYINCLTQVWYAGAVYARKMGLGLKKEKKPAAAGTGNPCVIL